MDALAKLTSEVGGLKEEVEALRDQVKALEETQRKPLPPDPPVRPEPVSERPTPVDISGISCEGTTCSIPRDTLEAMLANPAGLARQARVVPAMKDGRVEGYKIFAVRPRSMLGALGIRSGDVLLEVSGHSLRSIDAAMEAYAELRDEDAVDVTLRRRGETLTLRIEIDG